MTHPTVGPILLARGATAEAARLSVLMVVERGREPPAIIPQDGVAATPSALSEEDWATIWRYDFDLPSAPAAIYSVDGVDYEVAADLTAELRIAFISCNGQEVRDLQRPRVERNALWRDIVEEHRKEPFHLLLHGGDQLYADEVWQAHPDLSAWQRATRADREAAPFTPEMGEAARGFYLSRYLDVYSQPATAAMMARVPSLMIWDDHDIVDGWGSHPSWMLDSAVAQGVFAAARRFFRLMQLGLAPEEVSPNLPDTEGRSLGWRCVFPRLGILAPDLRSERRPDRVMGEAGWRTLERSLADLDGAETLLLLSSVPALGPRLSWVEKVIGALPHVDKYKDDLRDQWQSRFHRREWSRFLTLMERQVSGRGRRLAILSGEIHLATRGEMKVKDGIVHQFVASGISHPPPPRIYAACLGGLARVGGSPVPGRPIRLKPLPGSGDIYTAQRNYLVLRRSGGEWTARWRTEDSGWTGPLFF